MIDTELKKRRIQPFEEKDILRWGYEEKGTFNNGEAYNLIIKEHLVKDPIWSKVWDPSLWPKISTFLWLLCHNKILTWDNLRKRNFHGLSICPNCKQEEETIKHLMLSCHIVQKLWEKVSFWCQREGRIHGDIITTVRNWERPPYQSKILNFLWKLIPGILLWAIWKERNSIIFKDHSTPLENTWKIIFQNIEETISLKTRRTFLITPKNSPYGPIGTLIWSKMRLLKAHSHWKIVHLTNGCLPQRICTSSSSMGLRKAIRAIQASEGSSEIIKVHLS